MLRISVLGILPPELHPLPLLLDGISKGNLNHYELVPLQSEIGNSDILR